MKRLIYAPFNAVHAVVMATIFFVVAPIALLLSLFNNDR